MVKRRTTTECALDGLLEVADVLESGHLIIVDVVIVLE